MNRIVALSGKKQSGKNTFFNFMLGAEMLKLSLVRDKILVTPKGELLISDICGNTECEGIFDITRQTKSMDVMRAEIYPFLRNWSFADVLKQEVCINILGLSWEQCYGTDEQKKGETHLRWENMPGNVKAGTEFTESTDLPYPVIEIDKRGQMTGRDVMQYVGTEIFRKMFNDVWAESTLRRIKQYQDSLEDINNLSIITDCRFPNEVEAVQRAGGKVIRLTRQEFEDEHESETALDPENFDWNKF